MARNPGSWEGIDLCDGRYCSLKKLGEGGMGFVYQARDKRMGRFVVIKVPRAEMLVDSQFRKRFVRELQSLVKLEHRHIVAIQDYNQEDKIPYAVMQYLSNGDLDDRRSRDPQDLKKWLRDIASALDFVHKKGYVHRDVKPGNILFDEEGYAYLSDFGIAKVVADSEDNQQGLTQMGFAIGTPDYMAPELHSNKFDGRIDQYALAVTVYELVSGGTPYQGTTPVEIMIAHKTDQAAAIPNISAALNDVIFKGMAKDPNERFASCTEFADAVLKTINIKGSDESPPRQIGPTVAPIIARVDRSTRSVKSRPKSAQVRSSPTSTSRIEQQQERKLKKKRKEQKIWITAAVGFILVLVVVLMLASGSDKKVSKRSKQSDSRIEGSEAKKMGAERSKHQINEPPAREKNNLVDKKANQSVLGKSDRTARNTNQKKPAVKHEAELRAKLEADREKQAKVIREKISREINSLKQRVDESIQNAEKLVNQENNTQKALEVLRKSFSDVEKAKIPFDSKLALREKLQEATSRIESVASERSAEKKQKVADQSYRLGKALISEREYLDAEERFSTAINLKSDEPDYYVQRSICYVHLGNLSKAVADLSSAILLNPDSFEALNKRGLLQLESGEYDEAISDFRKAMLRNNAQDKSVVLSLMTAYEKKVYAVDGEASIPASSRSQRVLKEALSDCQATLAANPDANYICRYQAYFSLLLANYDQAIHYAKKATATNPKDEQAYEVLSRSEYAKKNLKNAIKYAIKITNINPKNYNAYNLAGFYLVEDNKPKRAVKDFYTKAIGLNPKNPLAYANRSEAYKKMGLMAKAMKDKAKANSLIDASNSNR